MNALSTLRLYEIADNYLLALEELAEMENLPEEVIADTLESWAATFEVKACNVAAYIRNLEAEAAAVEEVKKGMEKREKSLKRHAARLKAYLKTEMGRISLTKIKNPQLTLRVQNNPPSVIVDNEELIPETFKETVTTVKVLKSEIGKALKSGQNIAGARLEQTTRLIIS